MTAVRLSSGLMAEGERRSSTAEAPAAVRVLGERSPELALSEVGPEGVDEDELGVGELPEEEVRDAELAGRPDEEIGLGHLGRVEARRDRVLVDVARVDSFLDEAPGGLDDLARLP